MLFFSIFPLFSFFSILLSSDSWTIPQEYYLIYVNAVEVCNYVGYCVILLLSFTEFELFIFEVPYMIFSG